ncbi:ParB/RepB/Spo0J family partition protein [Paracoccus sulfuroxidans]|uniref:ParB/RepB/Spo0J family partition protein n=1 Tax=Paracoccus sulfuroxidans TaxID=384678 RepID=A0A562NBD2_9RHOB|nr:ParB/RepB/Spo0J family partition protein [Paracoccus sulfuroxidans]TWI29424.1 ParB/RepB/Spo0J family partition protein [Paracoccus sulfuroxidans]
MNILELPLTSIEVGNDRARDLDPAWVDGLVGSIQLQGLMQPIVVRPHGDGYRLVAGLHRLHAFQSLGRDTIPATLAEADTDDGAKLAEVSPLALSEALLARLTALEQANGGLSESLGGLTQSLASAAAAIGAQAEAIIALTARVDQLEANMPQVQAFDTTAEATAFSNARPGNIGFSREV